MCGPILQEPGIRIPGGLAVCQSVCKGAGLWIPGRGRKGPSGAGTGRAETFLDEVTPLVEATHRAVPPGGNCSPAAMLNSASMKRLLFVCMGNICRSPAAEGVFRSLLQKSGKEALIEVDSAGTIAYHAGSAPDARMQAAALPRGYRLRGQARLMTISDLDTFDLVIAMDRRNLKDIHSMAGSGSREQRGEVRLLSDYLGPEWPRDVPDPYYGGADGFEKVLDMIEAACPLLLEDLLSHE